MNETQNTQETAPTQPNNQPQETTSQPPPPNQPILEQKSKNTPVIILSILLIISLGVAGYFAYMYYQPNIIQKDVVNQQTTATPDTSPSPTPIQSVDINDSRIVYENSGYVYLKNGLDNTEIQIDKGTKVSYSSINNKIAYVKMDTDNNIYIYDNNNKTTSTIPVDTNRLRGVMWSPDGKYLITDSGTSPIGGSQVIEYSTNKVIENFSHFGAFSVPWLNSKELVFGKPENVTPIRPWGGGEGLSIFKLNTSDEGVVPLLSASGTEDYRIASVENNSILYSKTTVTDNNDWGNKDKEVVTYWKMDSSGNNKTEVSKPQTLKDLVQDNIPPEFSEYEVYFNPIKNKEINNWITFSLITNNSTNNSIICILDLESPKSSFRKIADGNYPSW